MASSSIQGFDSDVYLTETIPGLFRDAQAAASSVSSSVGPLYSETRMSTKRAILAWLSQSPTLKAWEGERQIKELTGNDYTIKADKYELTLGIDADDIDDLAERDAFAEQVMAGGEASAQHRDTLMWSFLRDDGETALCYDETPLFNASPPAQERGYLLEYRGRQRYALVPARYHRASEGPALGRAHRLHEPFDQG